MRAKDERRTLSSTLIERRAEARGGEQRMKEGRFHPDFVLTHKSPLIVNAASGGGMRGRDA